MNYEEKKQAIDEIIDYAKDAFLLPCFVFGGAVYSVEEAEEAMLDYMEDDIEENGWTLDDYINARKNDAQELPLRSYIDGTVESCYLDGQVVNSLNGQHPDHDADHCVVNYIDDNGKITIGMGTDELPWNSNVYTLNATLTLEKCLGGDRNIYVNGEYVQASADVLNTLSSYFPDEPELHNAEVDAEAENAISEYDGYRFFMDDRRGFANEWTLYVTKSEEVIEIASGRGWREIGKEEATDCIATANYDYGAMEINDRAVVVVDGTEEIFDN